MNSGQVTRIPSAVKLQERGVPQVMMITCDDDHVCHLLHHSYCGHRQARQGREGRPCHADVPARRPARRQPSANRRPEVRAHAQSLQRMARLNPMSYAYHDLP